jgi:hypothetical protein
MHTYYPNPSNIVRHNLLDISQTTAGKNSISWLIFKAETWIALKAEGMIF